MTNDMEFIRFQNIVDKVCEKTIKDSYGELLDAEFSGGVLVNNPALGLIFDYSNLGEYGKYIVKQTSLETTYNRIGWLLDMGCNANINDLYKGRQRIASTKTFIEKMNEEDYYIKDKYLFAFWSFVILAVDENMNEEQASMLADMLQMMNISVLETKELIALVKMIFDEELNEEITSKNIKQIFAGVIKMYK